MDGCCDSKIIGIQYVITTDIMYLPTHINTDVVPVVTCIERLCLSLMYLAVQPAQQKVCIFARRSTFGTIRCKIRSVGKSKRWQRIQAFAVHSIWRCSNLISMSFEKVHNR